MMSLAELALRGPSAAVAAARKKIPFTRPAVPDEVLRLASQLVAATPGHHRVVLWTPVDEILNSVGVAANLAQALIELQHGPVLLVDANSRRPTLHTQFGRDLEPGLVGVLRNNVKLSDALCPTADPELTVLPAGAHRSESSLIASADIGHIFEEVRKGFQYTVLQTPPYFACVDATLLAARADGVVIVAKSGKTRKAQLNQIKRELEAVNAHLVGVALVEER
jgi:receptor protein-tyrosine kinase